MVSCHKSSKSRSYTRQALGTFVSWLRGGELLKRKSTTTLALLTLFDQSS